MSRVSSLVMVVVLGLVAFACEETNLPQTPGIDYGEAAGGRGRPTQTIDGTVGGAWDAAPAVDAPLVDGPSPAVPRVDAAAPDTSPADAQISDPVECSLLIRTCPAGRACYPFGRQGTRCLFEGLGGSDVPVPCTEHQGCEFRHICHDSQVCLALCDVGARCRNGAICVPLAGYNNVGFCPQ